MLSSADKLRVIAYLKNFGCNSHETLAYLEMLAMGTTSVQELSRKLKRNRVTVYYAVHQLIKKGLLFETRKGSKRFIVAEDSDILSKLVTQKEHELNTVQENLPYISKLLHSIHVDQHEPTTVKLYEGAAGFKKMLEETLSAEKEILVFSNMVLSKIHLLGEEYFENYFKRRAEKHIHTRIIYPSNPFADKMNQRKEEYKIDMRVLPQDERSGSGFYLWNNTVAILSLEEDKRSCTIIENRDVAHFFRNNIFDYLWEQAKTL